MVATENVVEVSLKDKLLNKMKEMIKAGIPLRSKGDLVIPYQFNHLMGMPKEIMLAGYNLQPHHCDAYCYYCEIDKDYYVGIIHCTIDYACKLPYWGKEDALSKIRKAAWGNSVFNKESESLNVGSLNGRWLTFVGDGGYFIRVGRFSLCESQDVYMESLPVTKQEYWSIMGAANEFEMTREKIARKKIMESL